MAAPPYLPLFALRQLSDGRRAFALEALAARARALELPELAALADAALAADLPVRQLAYRRTQQRAGVGAPADAQPLDRALDQTLKDLLSMLRLQSRSPEPDRAAAARALLPLIDLGSVRALTQQAWPEQAAIARHVLEVLDDPARADLIEGLGLRPWAEQLRAHTQAFEAALDPPTAPPVRAEALRDARRAAHARLLRVVAAAVAATGAPGDEERCLQLLSPVLRMHAESRRGRPGGRKGSGDDGDGGGG
jgi:hypothetical protein